MLLFILDFIHASSYPPFQRPGVLLRMLLLMVIGSLFVLGTAGTGSRIRGATKPTMTWQSEYEPNERVPVYANKVGPLTDPWDVQGFYSLPFCQPFERRVQKRTFHEFVRGDDVQDSAYYVRFRVPVEWQQLCEYHYEKYEIEVLKKAVAEEFVAETVVDNVRMRHLIGYGEGGGDDSSSSSRCFLYNHLHFTFLVNSNQVIFANISTDARKSVELRDDQTVIEYSYSIEWVDTHVPYSMRDQAFQYNYAGVWEPGAVRWNVFLVGIGLTDLMFCIGIIVLVTQECLFFKEG
jgi:hypothetical protein